MCQYASFLVSLPDAARVYAGDLYSHEGIEVGWGLKPETYREGEWTAEGPEHLTIRGSTAIEREALRAALLARYPTLSALLSTVAEGRAGGDKYHFRDGKLDRADGPAEERADGSREWYRDGKLMK